MNHACPFLNEISLEITTTFPLIWRKGQVLTG